MKFLFTCGGTAGHINPAIAVAAQLRSQLPDCGILFIGAEDRMEMDLVPRSGYEIKGVRITNLSRSLSLSGLKHNAQTIRNVLQATGEAKRIIRVFEPDVVIGTGGYVCYPVLQAAHSLHIPTVIHESNAFPGLTTKMLAREVDSVLVGFEESVSLYPDASRVEVTGTPVRREFSDYTRASARHELGIEEDEKVVVSVWGSLGAGYMNDIMLSLIPKLQGRDFRLIHCTGKSYYEGFMEKLRRSAPDHALHGVEIREYIHDMPRLMMAADLILCRAGASTLSELTFIGKPALLIPSPNVTNNHQEINARVLEHAGGAKVLLEGEFTAEELLEEVRTLLSDASRCEAMGKSMLSLSYQNAAERIAARILSLAKVPERNEGEENR